MTSGQNHPQVHANANKTLANNLDGLKAAWATEFKKRADGGWWSLSGFSLQILAGLEQMLKRELIEKRPRAEVGIEAVSDAILSEEKTHLVQIKRHLTKAALEAAFSEAYDIASLCSDALQNDLRFQVVTMKHDPDAVVDVSLARRALRGRDTIDQTLMLRTLAMFDPTAPIRVSADPAKALRIVLWNAGVENPTATMNAMLGEILAAFDGNNRTGVQNALVSALDHAKREVRIPRPQAGHLYLPGELGIIATTPDNSILASASPRMPDLAMGRFVDRPDVLKPALKAAVHWGASLDVHIAAQLPSLPVFCIRGRSGDGKSVLLLQVVASLLEERMVATVTGLASFDDLKGWLSSRPKVRPGEPVDGVELAYIDDLPRRADTEALTKLIGESLAFASRPAALMTCGVDEDIPTTEGIHFAFHDLPQPSERDQRLFSARFGLDGPYTYDPEQSLAGMLVRLRRTSTHEAPLADQLAQAFMRQDLWPVARQIIAANLLGVPGAAAPSQARRLAAFTFDQAGISLRAEQRDGGFELGHAEHLAPVYQAWQQVGNFPHEWGSDLGFTIAAGIQNGNQHLARALLGRMVDGRAMSRRLRRLGHKNRDAHSSLLGAAFAATQAELDDVALAPVMRQWLVAQRTTKGGIVQALEDRAGALLDEPQVARSHKAEIALFLAHGSPDQGAKSAGKKRALALIEAVSDESLIVDHFTRLASRPGETAQARVRPWLIRHQRSLTTEPVLTAALRVNGAAFADYRTMGFRMVGANPTDSKLSELVRTLAMEPIEPWNTKFLDGWLSAAHPPQALGAIYTQLLKVKGGRRYLGQAITWLRQNVQTLGTHDLLSRLVAMQPDHELESLISAWFDAHTNDLDQVTVISAMLKQPLFLPSGLRLALKLLAVQRTAQTEYLAAVTAPIVQAMTARQFATLAQQLPPSLHRTLNSLRGARRPR
jgi:hypothetical protein